MTTTKGRKRVPEKKSDFNDYQRNTTLHLETGTPPRGEELGLTTEELEEWQAFLAAWLVLWLLYSNKSTRTSTVIEDVNTHMKNFSEFAEDLLTRMSGSPLLGSVDRSVLNIKERDKTPTRRGKINDTPIVGLKGGGGGSVKAKLRSDSDSSKASMHELSDLIEVKYLIANENPEAPDPNPGGGGPDLPSPEDAPHYFISSKANFEISVGIAHRGKFFIGFFRWVNSTNPANNGPWTLPQMGLIG